MRKYATRLGDSARHRFLLRRQCSAVRAKAVAMADIFLSYAKEDREVARSLSKRLIQAGWTVWWDRRIPAGRTWRRMLEAALRDMRCMVVLWSSHSIESDWVKEEAEEARLRKRLVPVLIEPVLPPVGFRTVQAADLTDWDGVRESRGVRQLIADLELILGKPAAQAEVARARRLPRSVDDGQTRTEVTVAVVETLRGGGRIRAHGHSWNRQALAWKIAAAAALTLVFGLAVIMLWRERKPVIDQLATGVVKTQPPSRGEIVPARVVKLMIDGARQELKPDETLPLSVRAQFSDGNVSAPAGAIRWSSSDDQVAKVDDGGRVTALQTGSTTITATHEGVSSNPWTIAVKSPAPKTALPPTLVGLTIKGAKRELEPKEKIALTVTGKYSDGTEKPVADGWVLASSNAAVASVNARGEVEAGRAGNAEIIARVGSLNSAPLRLVVRESQWEVVEQPRPREHPTYAAPESVPAPPERLPAEVSGEQLRAKIALYLNRAKNFRAHGDYRAAMAELASARAVDPDSREVGAEIEQTRRACVAERKLGNRELDCSP